MPFANVPVPDLCFQLETALKTERGDLGGMGDDSSTKSLVQQNIELRRKLDDEHSSYKRKLQAYQEGQQRQAQLVQKLQAKVRHWHRACKTDLKIWICSIVKCDSELNAGLNVFIFLLA